MGFPQWDFEISQKYTRSSQAHKENQPEGPGWERTALGGTANIGRVEEPARCKRMGSITSLRRRIANLCNVWPQKTRGNLNEVIKHGSLVGKFEWKKYMRGTKDLLQKGENWKLAKELTTHVHGHVEEKES